VPPSFKPTRLPVKAAAKAEVPTQVGEPTAPYKYEVVGKPEAPEPEKLPLPGKAPFGTTWVFNRLREPYTAHWDSKPIPFGPNEFLPVSAEIAPYIAAESVISFGRGSDVVRALVVQDKKKFGVPFKEGITQYVTELIDRNKDPNPIGRGTDGVPTKPKLIHIG